MNYLVNINVQDVGRTLATELSNEMSNSSSIQNSNGKILAPTLKISALGKKIKKTLQIFFFWLRPTLKISALGKIRPGFFGTKNLGAIGLRSRYLYSIFDWLKYVA